MGMFTKNTDGGTIVSAASILRLEEATKLFSAVLGAVEAFLVNVGAILSGLASAPRYALEPGFIVFENPAIGTLFSGFSEAKVRFAIIKAGSGITVVNSKSFGRLEDFVVHRDSLSVRACSNSVKTGFTLTSMGAPVVLGEPVKMPSVNDSHLPLSKSNKTNRLVRWLLNFRSKFLQGCTPYLVCSVAENGVQFA